MTYKELIEKTRELGVAIQDTDEFTAFIVAKTAADKSEKLQDKLGQFNLKKLDLNRAIIADEKDNEKIAALNAEVKTLYEEIVSDPLMIAYSTTKDELDGVARALVRGDDLRADETLAKHADWAEELKSRHVFTAENAGDLLRQEVGAVFATVLEHAGVFKRTPEGREAFLRFIHSAEM